MSYPDLEIQNEGSIFLLRPTTDKGARWIGEHTDPENRQFFGDALVVEHRYIEGIVVGAQADGLRVI
jgi:hypothetical protein